MDGPREAQDTGHVIDNHTHTHVGYGYDLGQTVLRWIQVLRMTESFDSILWNPSLTGFTIVAENISGRGGSEESKK